MSVLREILQILFGSIGFAIGLQAGLIKPQGAFLDNVFWGITVMIVSRIVSFLFTGGRK